MQRRKPATVDFRCPKCKAQLTAPGTDRGTRITCPHCNAVFHVPTSGLVANHTDVHVFCFHCQATAPAKLLYPGNNGVEAVLWAAGIVPGLFYRMWRTSDPALACTRCGSPHVQPDETPVARE